jgi:hypothetical protein
VPALRELQHAFGGALLAGIVGEDSSRSAAARLAATAGLDAQLLGIYCNTARSTLTNALSLSFPAVRKLVGEQFFESCARAFIPAYPPRGACLDDYGQKFPDFLARYAPAAGLGYLRDVALLEWAVNRALHAPDAAPADITALAELDAALVALLRFVPQPALSVLHLAAPADVIWRAVLDEDDAAMAAIDLAAGPVWLLIERTQSGLEVRRMSEGAARFTQRLCAGESLQAALDGAANTAEALDAVLADHLAAGRFTAWRAAPAQIPTGESSP